MAEAGNSMLLLPGEHDRAIHEQGNCQGDIENYSRHILSSMEINKVHECPKGDGYSPGSL